MAINRQYYSTVVHKSEGVCVYVCVYVIHLWSDHEQES